MARPGLQDTNPKDNEPYAPDTAAADQDTNKPIFEIVNRKRRVRPIPILASSGKTTPAGPLTYNFLDLGGPPTPNRIWNVMRYAIFGVDPFTAVSGNVIAYIAALPFQDSNTEPIFPNMVDLSTTIPNVGTWSGHALTLHWQEHLILAFKGVPASTALFGFLQAEEEDFLDFRVDRD